MSIASLIRFAKWLEKDPDNVTWFKKPVDQMDDEEVLEAVFWACY